MLPTRITLGQPQRKSRLGERQSFLPRRVGSTDRLSGAPRPSASGARSSSADNARNGARLSREASATKPPINRRSRSQQGDSIQGGSFTTPLRNNQFLRPTTPVRTPSGDRSRSWEASLDRALACVTVKDQRPITNTAWQRSTLARVQEALADRGETGATLIRPLTIARFVDIVRSLLAAITGDDKFTPDNYVTKLPNTCKRLLYPGTVAKSWLKTVNTLHAFPQALALIAYLLDLLQRKESPVPDEWLYVDNDEVSILRREYLRKCFVRFQTPGAVFEDLTAEYLQQLKLVLGADDNRIRELHEQIRQHEQALAEESEASSAEREREAALQARRAALTAAIRASRRNQSAARAAIDAAAAARRDRAAAIAAADADIARAVAEGAQLKKELEEQTMSVEERARLLDQVDYWTRVHDSKRVLAEQVAKMVLGKETDLALWQRKTLDSCVEYKQGLIHLAAQIPDVTSLAIDETKLMEPSCAKASLGGLDTLKALLSKLTQRRAQLARSRSALARERHAELEEIRATIVNLKSKIEQEIAAREADIAADASEAGAATARLEQIEAAMKSLHQEQEKFQKIMEELAFWKKQDSLWRAKLAEMREYIRVQKEKLPAAMRDAYKVRCDIVADAVQQLNQKLDSLP